MKGKEILRPWLEVLNTVVLLSHGNKLMNYITLHQQICAGEVELKLSSGLLWTGCIQVPNIIHSPITAGGLVSEVLYESDQPVVHSRQKEFLSILCQTLSENPQRIDGGTYHTVSWSLWTVLLQCTLYLSLSSVQRWLFLLEVSLCLAIS